MDEDRRTSEKPEESISIAEEQKVLFAEQIRQLYNNAPIGLLATAINSLALVAIQRNVIAKGALIAWLTLLALISVARYIEIRRFHRTSLGPSEAKSWGRRFIVGLALSGMAWGSAGIFLFPIESIVHQTFLTFVIGGMVAGAAASFSALPKAFFAYSVPALAPIIVRIGLLGDELHLAMAGMVLLFGLMMVFIAMRVNALTAASLKLRFENSGLVLVGQEFIELKRVKEVLQESEERFRQIAENIREVFWMANSDLTKMIYVSPAYEEIWGRKAKELYNNPKSWMDAIHPEDREGVEENLPLRGMGGFAVEYRIVSPDGFVRWIWDRAFPVRNEGGEVYRIAGIAEDITERKRAEEKLQESEERFRLLVENAPDAIFVQTEGRFAYVNKAAIRLFGGRSPEELLGHPVMNRFHPDYHAAVRERIRLLNEERKEVPLLEQKYLKLDGTPFDVEVSAVPFVYENQKGALVFFHDITDRKQAEEEKEKLEVLNQQLQKTESLGRMAAAIAHHFNNQLAVVMGNLQMTIGDLPQGAGPLNDLNAAMRAAHKAAEMSGLMLTYLGQTHGKSEPLDLSEACLRSLPILRAAMPRKVVLETHLPSPGPVIIGNANQIQQVLTNLLTNAWEAIGEDGGSIHVNVKTVSPAAIPAPHRYPIDWHPRDTAYALMEVADVGCGINEKDIERLFDPFFSSKFIGRGLGLSVVMGIVRAHGGGIAVESKPGRGSAFRIFFPICADEDPPGIQKGQEK